MSELDILSPANNSDVLDAYPWFRWESPGFVEGVQIDYNVYVYQYNPNIHSNYLDAIEDENSLYFANSDPITLFENGTPQQIQVQYPSDDRELACGYQYVWYVDARDIIEDEPFNSESGIWGWPEPIQSPIFVFNYGSIIKQENVISPAVDSEATSVRPTFQIDPINCASSYEIWLSNADDTNVENPIWISGALQSNVNQYPFDAMGLVPGNEYRWKIRMNPDGEPSPWSEIFTFRIMDYSLNDPQSGQELSSVTPTFYISSPADVSSYELRISNQDDPEVESGNIFSQHVMSFPFELPSDLSIGLLPGFSYYWKIIILDGNDNIVGEIDDYSKVESFRIEDVEIVSPSDASSDQSLTPAFMWDGPLGISQYEFSISRDDDPSVEDPFFQTQVSGTFFQYPQQGDYPLEYGTLYYWMIVPLDNNGNRGASSEYFSFITAVDMNEVAETEVSSKPEFSLTNGAEDAPKNIIVNLLNEIQGADEFLVYFAEDQEMASFLAELYIDGNQTNGVLDGTDLEWGSTIYVQIFALSEGEVIGEESSIQVISLPEKPGSDDQVGVTVSLEEGSTQPVIEITNIVANAFDYIIEVATDADMTEIFYIGPAFDDMPTIYPESADLLNFGETYFFQISATDDDGMHGIPSSIISIFIPNVVPPNLKEEFSWDSTIPTSASYNLQISTTDDFSSIVVDENIEGTSFQLGDGTLDPGTQYYWRVIGLDDSGNLLGDYSSIRLFETEGEQEEIVETEGGQIVVLSLPPSGEEISTSRPSFQWEAIETAEKYEIRVGASEDYSQLMWNSPNVAQSSVQYPSSGAETLLPETTYYWSVRAIANDVALGEFSESFTFTVSEDNTPVLTGPMNGLSESNLPYFTWNKISRASAYGLVLANNEDASQIIYESHNIAEKQFQYGSDLPPLEFDTSYYWKVIAYDENGAALGDYSTIATFTTPSGIIEIEFIYEEGGE